MPFFTKWILSAALSIAFLQQIYAQQKVRQYYPSKQEVVESYVKQQRLDSLLKAIPLNARIQANWQRDNSFWYVKYLPADGREYYYVNAVKGTKQKAFDQERLAAGIRKFTGKEVSPLKLNITKMFFSANAKSITFKNGADWLQCDLGNYRCEMAADTSLYNYDSKRPLQSRTYRWEAVHRDSISPDKKWRAYSKGGNLFIKELEGGKDIQLSRDGSLDKPYGDFSWSRDSKHVIGYLSDPVVSKKVYYVLSSVAGTSRGQLRSHEVLSEKSNKIKKIFFLTLPLPRGSILRYFDGMFTLFSPAFVGLFFYTAFVDVASVEARPRGSSCSNSLVYLFL